MVGKGSAPGERRGGRKKGTKNLRTIERELRVSNIVKATTDHADRRSVALIRAEEEAREAARRVQDAERKGLPLAKEILEQFAVIFYGLASRYQPKKNDDESKGSREDLVKFKEWALLACSVAKDLAPYQSPKLSAIMVQPPAPEITRKRFTLAIFDSHHGDEGVQIEADAIEDETEDGE